MVFVIWHNRLFVIPECYRRYRGGRPMYGLISASGDGAWLAAFFSLLNIGAVRGSSSRHGREAAAALVEVLQRGPCRRHHARTARGARATTSSRERSWWRGMRAPPLLLFGAAIRRRLAPGQLGPVSTCRAPFSRVRIQSAANGSNPADCRRGGGRADAIAARSLRALNPDSCLPGEGRNVGVSPAQPGAAV